MTRSSPFHYSELQAARRCPQKYFYGYLYEGVGLRRITEALTLKRGLWLHAMLQADALKRGLEHGSLLETPETIDVPGRIPEKDGEVWLDAEGRALVLADEGARRSYELSWRGMLELLTTETDWALLPDEVVSEHYTEGGQSLPEACRNVMRGYLWQYRNVLPKRQPLLVEKTWRRTNDAGPVPIEHEGRVDLVELDERGIPSLVDWKTTKAVPGQEFRLMESQRWLYVWGIEPIMQEHANRLDQDLSIRALVLDYLVTKTPTKPKQNKDGTLSKRAVQTTPLVYFEALKEYGIELDEHHREVLEELERTNDFYRREMMPVNQKALTTVLLEAALSAQMAQGFREAPGTTYRNVDRSCTFMCDFLPLCQAELYGMDAQTIRDREYVSRSPETEEDPDE